jgi:hypothetical protein
VNGMMRLWRMDLLEGVDSLAVIAIPTVFSRLLHELFTGKAYYLLLIDSRLQ